MVSKLLQLTWHMAFGLRVLVLFYCIVFICCYFPYIIIRVTVRTSVWNPLAFFFFFCSQKSVDAPWASSLQSNCVVVGPGMLLCVDPSTESMYTLPLRSEEQPKVTQIPLQVSLLYPTDLIFTLLFLLFFVLCGEFCDVSISRPWA